MAVAVIHVNCPDVETADRIATAVLSARLAASSNIYPSIRSQYWWKGELHAATEVVLILKTRGERIEAAISKIQSLHPYEVPSILVHRVDSAGDAYAQWVEAETS